MSFIDVGFSNYFDSKRILGVSQVDSAPIRRLITQAKEEGRFIDVTQGRKTRSIIYSECGDKVVLIASAVHSLTIINRIARAEQNQFSDKQISDDLIQVSSTTVH